MNTLDAALLYHSLGWSICPCPPRTKHPAMPWKLFQEHRAQIQDVYKWWKRTQNIAVITGSISRIIVMDVDGPEGLATIAGRELPPTPCVRTGSGGLHYYYQHPGFETGNKVRELPGLDWRGDGGLVIAPPSIHPNGNAYEWLIPPHDVPVAPAPAWFVALLPHAEVPAFVPSERHTCSNDGSPYGLGALRRGIDEILNTPPGRRNVTLNNVALGLGHLVAGGELARPVVEAELVGAGLRVGLDEYNVKGTVASGLNAGEKTPRAAPEKAWTPQAPYVNPLSHRRIISMG